MEDDVSYIETEITNCGTADELAETACRLAKQIRYLLECDDQFLCHVQLRTAYENMREAVLAYAGIESDIDMTAVDQAILNYRTG